MSKTFVKDDVAALVKGLVNRDEKINAIFNHVKSTMKWNNFISIYSSNLKKSYEKGEGNSADINLLLVLMLREAGINANPILLSTKANGIPLFPTRSGFNYVICGVEVHEDVLLFDATEPYTSKDVLPTRVINWQGRILRKDGSSVWVSLEPKRNTKVTTMINAAITEDLALEGKVRSSYSDHSAKSFRTRNNGRSTSELASSTQQDKGDILIENVVVKNEKDLSKNILKSYEFTANDAVEEIGGALYLSPLLFLADDENIFKQDTRSYPIDFVYPITEKYVVTIAIPSGYEVTSLPENKTHVMQDNIGGFDYQIAQKGSNIQVIMTKRINYSMVPKDYYSAIKNYFTAVVKKETEKVILSKS